jgi:predicted transcriptional regulator
VWPVALENLAFMGLAEYALTESRLPFYTYYMHVNIPPELQAKLDRISAQQGRAAESLVNEAIERLVGYDEWFIRQVEKGLAQLERGETLEHEQVAAKMEVLIREKQRRD